MVFTAITYGSSACVPVYDKAGKLVSIFVSETQTYDGAASSFNFPSAGRSDTLLGFLQDKVFRIKSATMYAFTLAGGPCRVYVGMTAPCTGYSYWYFPSQFLLAGEAIDLGVSDVAMRVPVRAYTPLFACVVSTAAASDITVTSAILEVME